jgi:hypothetical protein
MYTLVGAYVLIRGELWRLAKNLWFEEVHVSLFYTLKQ